MYVAVSLVFIATPSAWRRSRLWPQSDTRHSRSAVPRRALPGEHRRGGAGVRPSGAHAGLATAGAGVAHGAVLRVVPPPAVIQVSERQRSVRRSPAVVATPSSAATHVDSPMVCTSSSSAALSRTRVCVCVCVLCGVCARVASQVRMLVVSQHTTMSMKDRRRFILLKYLQIKK